MIELISYMIYISTLCLFILLIIDQLFLSNFKKFDAPNAHAGVSIFKIIYAAMPYLFGLSFIVTIYRMRMGLDFDFNLILVPATLFLLLIIILDKVYYHDRKQLGKTKERVLIATAYDFFPIIAFVLVMRSFIGEPFNIPSSSMVPTLYTGDFIAVNKYAYGIRLPLINTKVLDIGSPQHGDVVVFRYPQNPKQYYIKRTIGLPGDTVSFNNGVLSVNGKPIDTTPASYTPDPVMTAQIYPAGKAELGQDMTLDEAISQSNLEETHAKYLQETPTPEHPHLVRYLGFEAWYQYADFLRRADPNLITSEGKQWQVKVPAGHYFVMGDNRDRSADSRFWGFVPDKNIAGKAMYIWMHKEGGLHLPTFSRNGRIH